MNNFKMYLSRVLNGDNGRFTKDLVIKILSELVNLICSLLTFSIFARLLTKSDYAVSNQLISLGTLIAPIILLRINTAYCVFLPGESDLKIIKSRFFSSVLISMIICTIMTIIIIIYRGMISYLLFKTSGYKEIIPIISIYYALFSISTLAQDFYRATGEIKKSSTLITANALLRVILFIVTLKIGKAISLNSVLYLYCTTELVIALIGVLSIYIKYHDIPIKICFSKLKEYYWYSLPLVPYSIFAWINTSISKFMINHLINLETSAVFTFNYTLVTRVFVLNMILSYTIFPYISKFWNIGRVDLISKYLLKAFNIGIFFGLPMTCGLLVVSPTIANILSNGNYQADKFVIAILCIAMIFNMLYTVFSYLIDLSRKTIWYTIILLITSIMNVVLNYILIPSNGIYGAAIVFLLTNIVQVSLVIFIGLKITDIKIDIKLNYIIRSLVISFIMYLVTSFVYKDTTIANFIASIFVGVLTYFGLQLLTSKILKSNLV